MLRSEIQELNSVLADHNRKVQLAAEERDAMRCDNCAFNDLYDEVVNERFTKEECDEIRDGTGFDCGLAGIAVYITAKRGGVDAS